MVQSLASKCYIRTMKRRKQRKLRSALVFAMILTRKGGPMRDRRARRTDNPNNIDWS